jgi:hypothetical protein
MKSIQIIVASDGSSRIETHGFTGDACREASRLLEAALGKTTSEKLTAEFYEARHEQKNHLEQER